MQLTSANDFAYRIELLTQFAYKKQICLGESRLALSAKKLLTCWYAELLIEIVFIHAFIEFSYERHICWIADTICLQATDLLNCWHGLLRENKFAEFLTKFADIMNLLIKFADNGYPCRLGCINNLTKILASRPSEHGWRGMVWVSNLTAEMCLGRTFLLLVEQHQLQRRSPSRLRILLVPQQEPKTMMAAGWEVTTNIFSLLLHLFSYRWRTRVTMRTTRTIDADTRYLLG